MIYEIRGKQVMLDSDLARLYGCKNGTKSLNLAVKRHINRFPERFMFQLTKEEYSSIYSRFQFETLNKNNQKQGLNIKYLSYVFTEQGVAMLSTILKTDVAEEISIKIMDAFVVRKNINTNKEIMVTSTSCNIVDFATFKEEIIRNNFKIIKCYISSDIPNFDKCICAIISK
jgi:citrate lyase synthetase